MNEFARLYASLDATNKTNQKVAAMADYFQTAPPADAAWAVYFLSGQKVRQIIPTRQLASWASHQASIPEWLFEECYEAVGDLAETMALILPRGQRASQLTLEQWVTQRLLPLRGAAEDEQRMALTSYWDELDSPARLVLHKLLTGSFRVGVSQKLVVRALAAATGLPSQVLAHRLMGTWEPTADFFQRLTDPEASDTQPSQPYPFFLAHPLEEAPETLGPVTDWQIEWKWDGIRAQLIQRGGDVFIWSRGEELMTDRLPELLPAAHGLPSGTVLDGEVIAWKDEVLPFAVMQKRIGRKQLGKKILSEAPVIFLAFDLLEHDGQDLRERPLAERRAELEVLLARRHPSSAGSATFGFHPGDPGDSIRAWIAQTDKPLVPAPRLADSDWESLRELRQRSREFRTEGLMLKRRSSAYGVGRTRGEWWKWKIEPYTIDAVLIYAQRGSGKRASLYTDYTFGVWDRGELVPFAKAYSGLTHAEIDEVDRYVRQHTEARFGPVRQVTPGLVFEVAFEDIRPSQRHKSGIAVRFPRMVRWRRDLSIDQADSLDQVKEWIDKPGDRTA